ncbi:hypothetical protein GCM10022235_43480 [Kribbella ginsengisoli]|uniref:Uncharacterized protein n=1 Tax=Kribbella ginsengisoli TaxID=363865 RepID=A0ABP6XP71_9ACTN
MHWKRLTSAAAAIAVAAASTSVITTQASASGTPPPPVYPKRSFHISVAEGSSKGELTFFNRSVGIAGVQDARTDTGGPRGARYTKFTWKGTSVYSPVTEGTSSFHLTLPANQPGGAIGVEVWFYETDGGHSRAIGHQTVRR